MISLEWRNSERTILARINENHIEIIEPGNVEWRALCCADGIAPYIAPTDFVGVPDDDFSAQFESELEE
jgi:hypothetical protein